MIGIVIPTRNRPERLRQTLERLGRLPAAEMGPGACVVVVDNDSSAPIETPARLDNRLRVRLQRLPANLGAAARNVGARIAGDVEWLVMLDDDSAPLDAGFVRRLHSAPPEVAALAADITLPDGRREVGGLPEVFVGCGAAIRRRAFLAVGGYDGSFGYYVEEYDLCARLLLDGWRVRYEPWFRVRHERERRERDMDRILRALVRNNGWVIQRYAPEPERRAELRTMRARYRQIARKERALAGYGRGLVELRASIGGQQRRPMPEALWARFTGLAAARAALGEAQERAGGSIRTAALVDEGKQSHLIRRILAEMGIEEVDPQAAPDALVIGTLSPGPMLDACARRMAAPGDSGPVVIAPWRAADDRAAPPLALIAGAELATPPMSRAAVRR
ncbi:MAG: glycosyltransferase family 2 protein [Phycisphaerales bacterium JB039]